MQLNDVELVHISNFPDDMSLHLRQDTYSNSYSLRRTEEEDVVRAPPPGSIVRLFFPDSTGLVEALTHRGESATVRRRSPTPPVPPERAPLYASLCKTMYGLAPECACPLAPVPVQTLANRRDEAERLAVVWLTQRPRYAFTRPLLRVNILVNPPSPQCAMAVILARPCAHLPSSLARFRTSPSASSGHTCGRNLRGALYPCSLLPEDIDSALRGIVERSRTSSLLFNGERAEHHCREM
ncbi:hypothetical protein B0H13DRAFT_2340190 [Mycena leptocephala]|nr:hypothetical protein B0H13DRAFT_2340190 [Mycena leptocephala]